MLSAVPSKKEKKFKAKNNGGVKVYPWRFIKIYINTLHEELCSMFNNAPIKNLKYKNQSPIGRLFTTTFLLWPTGN
jgi:hypothetical protein